MARKDKFKIQIGDILYEPSIMYGKVIKHEVIDCFVEDYISGYKTIFVTKSYLGISCKFLNDIRAWCDTEEDAIGMLEKHREVE